MYMLFNAVPGSIFKNKDERMREEGKKNELYCAHRRAYALNGRDLDGLYIDIL